MCTVHHHHMCTDVYLQGSWVGNEKITGSYLPADVKAVSRAFSCAAHAGASTMEECKLFLSVTVLEIRVSQNLAKLGGVGGGIKCQGWKGKRIGVNVQV